MLNHGCKELLCAEATGSPNQICTIPLTYYMSCASLSLVDAYLAGSALLGGTLEYTRNPGYKLQFIQVHSLVHNCCCNLPVHSGTLRDRPDPLSVAHGAVANTFARVIHLHNRPDASDCGCSEYDAGWDLRQQRWPDLR